MPKGRCNKRTRPVSGRFFMAVVLGLLLGGGCVWGQKLSSRNFDAANLTQLQIAADQIFEVELYSASSGGIQAEIAIEGEYQNDLTVTSKKEGSTLILEGSFMPAFENPNDKLSAHKVVSVRLKVGVPDHLGVVVSGTGTRVAAKGYFNSLEVSTGKGPVVLEEVTGMIEVKTLSGEILVTDVHGEILAVSNYGQVFRGAVTEGNAKVKLESVNGDIYINKQE
ncbi:hypothetical protein E7Z59_04020 [Robertkochia marina]|uniref:Adhesin domain-containing protein n=1 Tax=Robertkochia marina TaxID=1227945 RepID=A0A4S3M361_9FLAO|nr:hypothetical protein [Robertkochia marina]THD69503.1 hypothetical protein E7Z59_04020 [Robertkochia marina]